MPEEQAKMFPKPEPTARPLTGPTCKTCGLTLYHYDIQRGECFTHVQERHIKFWKQPVRLTQPQRAAERS